MWEYLALVKVYTKKRGAHPDLTDPICLRKGATIEASALDYSVINLLMRFNRVCARVFIGLSLPISDTDLSGESSKGLYRLAVLINSDGRVSSSY